MCWRQGAGVVGGAEAESPQLWGDAAPAPPPAQPSVPPPSSYRASGDESNA